MSSCQCHKEEVKETKECQCGCDCGCKETKECQCTDCSLQEASNHPCHNCQC